MVSDIRCLEPLSIRLVCTDPATVQSVRKDGQTTGQQQTVIIYSHFKMETRFVRVHRFAQVTTGQAQVSFFGVSGSNPLKSIYPQKRETHALSLFFFPIQPKKARTICRFFFPHGNPRVASFQF